MTLSVVPVVNSQPIVVAVTLSTPQPKVESVDSKVDRVRQKWLNRSKELPEQHRKFFEEKIQSLSKQVQRTAAQIPRWSSAAEVLGHADNVAQGFFEQCKNYDAAKGAIEEHFKSIDIRIANFKAELTPFQVPKTTPKYDLLSRYQQMKKKSESAAMPASGMPAAAAAAMPAASASAAAAATTPAASVPIAKLPNGIEVPVPTLVVITMNLKHLRHNNYSAFFNLVRKCRDENHQFVDLPWEKNSKEILTKKNWIDSQGNVQSTVKDIILECVTGKGLDMEVGCQTTNTD